MLTEAHDVTLTAAQQRERLKKIRADPIQYVKYLQAKRAEYQKHKSAYSKRFKKYHDEHRDEILKHNKEYYQTNKHLWIKSKRQRTEEARGLLFHLIGKKCIECGIKDIRCLFFDHIKNGGRKDRQRFRDALAFYQWYLFRPKIAKKTLQTMCANCNWIKEYERRLKERESKAVGHIRHS